MGPTGCSGIGFQDVFLTWTSCVTPGTHQPLADKEQGPLSLGDLEGVKPKYPSNITVNDWCVGDSETERKYELLVMSPTVIERLDRRPGEEQFDNKLDPQDIDLSTAMATSAAAVARHMGAYGQSAESFKKLQTVLGLGMGASMVSDVESLKRENFYLRVSISS